MSVALWDSTLLRKDDRSNRQKAGLEEYKWHRLYTPQVVHLCRFRLCNLGSGRRTCVALLCARLPPKSEEKQALKG